MPSSPSAKRLIVFARYPEPGRAKTRLVPALGAQGASDLYRRLAEHAIANALALRRSSGDTDLLVSHAGGTAAQLASWLGPGVPCAPQAPGDLGRRMDRAFHDAFGRGVERAVIIGTDCPWLTPALLRRAFDALATDDLVLGPASDGGYYLIGLRRPASSLFDGIDWSTERVLGQTLARADAAGLRVRQLEVLSDVDRPEDIERLPPLWPLERESG